MSLSRGLWIQITWDTQIHGMCAEHCTHHHKPLLNPPPPSSVCCLLCSVSSPADLEHTLRHWPDFVLPHLPGPACWCTLKHISPLRPISNSPFSINESPSVTWVKSNLYEDMYLSQRLLHLSVSEGVWPVCEPELYNQFLGVLSRQAVSTAQRTNLAVG